MTELNIEEIKKYIPHRYPFLLVDRVEELVENSHIVAYKNVTVNEPFFQGHFPAVPIMPGVLTLEAMAQAAGVLSAKSLGDDNAAADGVYLLAGAEKVRYKTPIFPGDSIRIDVKILKVKSGLWQYEGRASVNDKLACSAIIYCKGVTHEEFAASIAKNS